MWGRILRRDGGGLVVRTKYKKFIDMVHKYRQDVVMKRTWRRCVPLVLKALL